MTTAVEPASPRLIAWELTRACPLACRHCRASAKAGADPAELTTRECFGLLKNIASFARPILILTGGEPMLRPDICDIAAEATRLGLRAVLATCGAMFDRAAAGAIAEAGVARISVSLDGAEAATHDAFRGAAGAFEAALAAIEAARSVGLEFQVNTTVARHNVAELPAIRDLAARLGAVTFNPFLLVPAGRARGLSDQELSPKQYEKTLRWLAEQAAAGAMAIRVTCAPHYQRILRQMGIGPSGPGQAKGCLAGQSFAFISHRGVVQPCGFLELPCGELRACGLDFQGIWRTAEPLRRLRDIESYHGRCGYCEFRRVCGGCRARAYAQTGDYLAEEPFCLYQPKAAPPGPAVRGLDDLDKLDRTLLTALQVELPVCERPFEDLAGKLQAEATELQQRVARLEAEGFIRRIGAVFDPPSLGYASTLLAASVPEDRLEEVAQIVNNRPEVTHNYRRDHRLNLWFTLTAASKGKLEEILEELRRRTGLELCSLPAEKTYKIRTFFPLDDRVAPPPGTGRPGPVSAVCLSGWRKELAGALAGNLPVSAEPFAALADRLGRPVGEVIAQVKQWLDAGVIRRVAAVVDHCRLGYAANAMVCFAVDPQEADGVGEALAGRADVSHCYRRRGAKTFPYNLFAMFHSRDAQVLRRTIDALAAGLPVEGCEVLFTLGRYKKRSARYFS